MVSREYSIAISEVLDILDHTRKEDVNKISSKFMDFLNNNKSNDYVSNLDHSKKIGDMNLKEKTSALLGLIYLNYWADENGKKEFNAKIRENEIKYQQELKEKYSTENLFKNKNVVVQENEVIELPIEIPKESFFRRIINKIKRILGR